MRVLSHRIGLLTLTAFVPLLLSAVAAFSAQAPDSTDAVADSIVSAPPADTTLTAPAAPDSVLALPADSAAVQAGRDSLERASLFPSAALDSLSRGLEAVTASQPYADYSLQTAELESVYGVYLEDILHQGPSLLPMDSLGRGGPVGLNAYGTGFSQLRLSLNGMPLVDPLTGGYDTRVVPLEVLGSAVLDGDPGSLAGVYGGAAALSLQSRTLERSPAVSRMGLSGGSYQLNRMGGGLRRGLFGRGALHVDINKVQQDDEAFFFDYRQLQYYTRLEQSLGRNTLLSIDGLYFADTRKANGSFPRQKQDNTWIQAALAGNLGLKTSYSLALRHSSSQHPWRDSNGALVFAGGVGDGYAASLEHRATDALSLGLRAEEEHDRARELSLETGSVRNRLLAAHAALKAPAGLNLKASAGYRLSNRTDNTPVFSLGLGRPAGAKPGFNLSLSREALSAGLLDLAALDGTSASGKLPVGRITRAGTGVSLNLASHTRLSAGALYVNVSNHSFNALDPDPYALTAAPLRVDYSAAGLEYALESTLPMGFGLTVRGRELFNAPESVPYLPARSHSATLACGGQLFHGDLGYSLRAELRYDSQFSFIPAGEVSRTVTQPGRVDLGGSASVRIIDLIIYGRLDHLLANYYNETDPLHLAAPRALFGITWNFYD